MTQPSEKIAIILFNLGAPDGPDAVRPFLRNLFADKAILPLPQPFRFLLASYIVWRREATARENYDILGGGSPLYPNTLKQADALETILNEKKPTAENTSKPRAQYKCFISMRYWHPFSHECARSVAEWKADRVVLLPLYPQFSTTTTQSSIDDWNNSASTYGLDRVPHHTICCWPTLPEFCKSAQEAISADLKEVNKKTKSWHLLFSAHGIPQDFVKKFGDPYPAHVTAGVHTIAKGLRIPDKQWSISYQSRVGKATWLQPYTETRIRELAQLGEHIVIYPISFVSEHSETLVELDVEYRELAMEYGAVGYTRVSTVDTHPTFIRGLSKAVYASINGDSSAYTRICPHAAFGCFRRSLFHTTKTVLNG